ncbi:LysR family transcriptional regulator [Paraburkholderia acidipaludis]|uniref:LysR family transcriptional regulator n=1 Tax=Paraburkholderia acidipaludis TaxID=660537 RepID=UPI00048253BE|nr:LysR family transcriptional regulator [Paraburkholderia acidipaludis]
MVNPIHFDLQSLRVFLMVAEQGSLTKAAERGHLTLSAVSKRIAELESVTDCALLIRRPRGIELTAAGRGLVEHASRVLDQVNSMASEMSDYAIGVRGHVRLWANTSAVVQFLPGDLAGFLGANRSIRISLEERLSGDIVEAVKSGKADLGIFADNVPSYGIARRLYRRDELVLLVPQSHPLAREEQVDFAQTLEEDYVGLNTGSSLFARLTDAAFEAGRPLKLRIQVSSFDGICRMIESGLGIGILPREAVRQELLVSRLGMVRLTDAWASRTLWISANDSSLSALEVARLFDFLSGGAQPEPAHEAP